MTDHIAVLIDGDCINAALAPEIKRIAEELGTPIIRRVYGNMTKLANWDKQSDFSAVHSGTGKNATDMLIAIDAVELAFERPPTAFVIATCDSDFRHLALRLRERGFAVTGIGPSHAAKPFIAACTAFIPVKEQAKQKPANPCVTASPNTTDLDTQIRETIVAHGENRARIKIVELGLLMRRQHGTQISTHPGKNWRNYLNSRESLFRLDPKGPNAYVHLKSGSHPCNK